MSLGDVVHCPDHYSVWSQHRQTYERCIYGTYLDLCDAQQVVEEMNVKCPDERYYIKELEE